MNINQTLLYIKGRIPKFLVSHKFIRYRSVLSTKAPRTIYQTLWKENFLKHVATPRQVPFLFHSSVASEEVLKKYSDSVIAVPSLQFEDNEFEQPVSHIELCNALKSCSSLEEQLVVLSSTLALSPDEVEKRLRFCKVIESLLRPFFGEIKIQIFGSTVNGFGFKGCDIDMSFETFANKKDEISYLECPDVPLVSEVMCGKVTPEEISLLPRREQLLFIHSVLLEFYKETAEPIIFINAHVPLVRFYHDKYNLKCDLSCGNRVAFANTKLLYLFQKLDERVIPMMMTIRYWAKHVELIGKGLLFNTYTISLLVIHFLQTRNPPVLPSAKDILSISDSLEVTDMNDTSFLEIQKSVHPSENTQTLAELLKDFFFFYLYFDFTRVICPLIGGSVSREKFFSNLPNRKFRMNTICVQDPMLESHNVADLVDYKTCKKLVSEVISVCRLLQDNSNLIPSPSTWGLLTLLDKSDKYLPCNINLEKNIFTIPVFNRPIINNFVHENKSLMTAETLLHLLQHILLFECKTLEMSDIEKLLKKQDEVIEKQRKIMETVDQLNSELQDLSRRFRKKSKQIVKWNETPMLGDFQKMNAEHTLILCAECKVLKNTWLGRDFVSVESLPSDTANDLIEKEHFVSVSAAKQNEMNSMDGKTKPFTFIYECYLSSKDPEAPLLVNLRPFKKTNFNPILGIFLKEYVPKLIKDLNEYP